MSTAGREPMDVPAAPAPAPRARRPRRRRVPLSTTLAALVAAIGVLHFYRPQRELLAPPFVAEAGEAPVLPFATPAPAAFGRSGTLRMHFVRPGGSVALPLAITDGSPRVLFTYQWVRAQDSVAVGAPRNLPLTGLIAPAEPGYYRLALAKAGQRRLVAFQTLAVMVPFEEKQGAMLRGFRLGTWAGERRGARAGLPDGFVPVDSFALALPVTDHLTLGDVLRTPDTPRLGFPQYAAVDTRLLEKLELVLAEVARRSGDPTVRRRLTINSGFRPPSYNAGVAGAAGNSRHQFGDAADIRIDADGDGRFTLAEVQLIVKAVAAVEAEYPDLRGGLGLYTSKRFRQPYVHIDARGTPARWRG